MHTFLSPADKKVCMLFVRKDNYNVHNFQYNILVTLGQNDRN